MAVDLGERFRGSWRGMAERDRAIVSLGIQVGVSILLWFVDGALGYGAAFLFALIWRRRLQDPWRLALELALIAAFAYPVPALAIAMVILFAAFRAPQRYRRWLVPGGALLAAIAYPFFQTHLFTIPILGAFPDVGTGVYMIVFVMMAVGLNIVVGYAGLLDLGYVAFYATGAYTTAWFASEQFAHRSIHFGAVGLIPANIPGIHITIWLLIPLAGILTALCGIIIGLPTLRLRGDYLAIVTLGFGEILPQIARNGDNLGGFNLTNGPNGILPLDPPGFGNHLSSWTGGFLPANYITCCKRTLLGHAIQSNDVYFWTALVLLVITVFCSLRLRDSRLGRAWIAIREDETAAAAMGIPLMRTKTWAYASGAFFGGVAGAYYAAFKSNTFPGDFFFNISVFILCMVILGGMGNVWGVIIGAAFLAYLNQFGLGNTGAWLNTHIHLFGWRPNIDVAEHQFGIYGVIILVMMLFRPEGLMPSRRIAAEMHEGVRDEPLYDVVNEGT
ncbi:MAG TPA: branched-chain amino acid ABC transporter permease [Gaiellaceae bacterium]